MQQILKDSLRREDVPSILEITIDLINKQIFHFEFAKQCLSTRVSFDALIFSRETFFLVTKVENTSTILLDYEFTRLSTLQDCIYFLYSLF